MRTRHLAIAVGLSAVSVPGAARGETLDAATAAAIAGDPGLGSARAAWLASTAVTAAAVARARVQLGFSARATHDFDNDPYAPRVRDESGFRLALPLYSGGRLRNAIAAARLREAATAADYSARADDLRISVAEQYDRLLAADDAARLADEEARALDGQVARLGSERGEGFATRTDTSQAQARLSIARARYETAVGQGAETRATFRRVVGIDGGGTTDPGLPEVPGDLATLTDAAIRYSPGLRALQDRVAAAARDVEATRALGRPTLSLTGKASYGNTDMLLAETRRFPHRAFAQIGLSLTVPLYAGGQIAAQTARADAIRRELQDDAEAERRRLVSEVRTGYYAYRGALARLAAADDARQSAAQALDGVRIEHEAGTRTPLDILNALREYAGARREAASARRQAHLEAVALLVRAGAYVAREREAGAPPTAAATAPMATLDFDLARLSGSRQASRHA